MDECHSCHKATEFLYPCPFDMDVNNAEEWEAQRCCDECISECAADI